MCLHPPNEEWRGADESGPKSRRQVEVAMHALTTRPSPGAGRIPAELVRRVERKPRCCQLMYRPNRDENSRHHCGEEVQADVIHVAKNPENLHILSSFGTLPSIITNLMYCYIYTNGTC